MTIQELLDLNDDQLLAALQGALERAEADERDASARVAKYARVIDALGVTVVEHGQCHDCGATGELAGGICRDGCRIVARATKPPKPKAPGKPKAAAVAAKRAPKPCCGSVGPRHRSDCEGVPKPAALTAVPDPVPDATPESRHPSMAPEQPSTSGYYECSSCTETFAEVAKLVSHTLDVHNRVPRSAERVPIPA